MARTFCNASFATALSDCITVFANSRGYTTAAAAMTAGSRTAVEQKPVKGGAGDATTSWVPDPVTGYYRPANRLAETDAVDLRELLLTRKSQE